MVARLLTILSLILVLLLFPPATLALISNNAVPGDTTYPIKRGLEDIIFSVASLNPVTKAWFSAARSDRRFQEVSVLVTSGKEATKTVDELVEQTQVTANEIAQVTDEGQKQKLVQQLSDSIDKYDQGLKDLSTSKSQGQIPSETVPQPTPVQPETTFQPTAQPAVPTSSPRPSSSATTVRPSATPVVTPTPSLSPSQTPRPTAIPSTPRPSPTPVPTGQPSDCDQIKDEFQKARCELEKIRNGLHDQSTSHQSPNTSSHPSPKPTSEGEDHAREKQ